MIFANSCEGKVLLYLEVLVVVIAQISRDRHSSCAGSIDCLASGLPRGRKVLFESG